MAKSVVLPIVLGLGALGLGAAILVGSSDSAERVPLRTGNPPADVIQRIVSALATNDPNAMRVEATKLEREGWRMQATELRRAADAAAVAQSVLRPKAEGVSGSVNRSPHSGSTLAVEGELRRPQPDSPLPGLVPRALARSTATPLQRLTNRMVLNLLQNDPGKEDRGLVREFQRLHPGLKVTGMYGPGTALRIANEYWTVPPRPFYWPKADRVRVKRRYRALMLKQAREDPQRSDEWTAAAMVT